MTYAAIEADLGHRDPGALAEDVTAHVARPPADRFPLITRHGAQPVAGDADERFRFAIDTVIDSTLARKSPTPAATAEQPPAASA